MAGGVGRVHGDAQSVSALLIPMEVNNNQKQIMNNTISLKKLAEMVAGEVIGDGSLEIVGFGPLDTSGPGELSFLAKAKDSHLLEQSKASAFIVTKDVEIPDKTLVRVEDPYLASAIVQNHFLQTPFVAKGIHKMAAIGNDCTIPDEISIGPHAAVGDRVKLGERVEICSGAVIGDDVTIGNDCLIKANVTIEHGCELGERVIIHPGTVIGSDGYGYATDRRGFHVKRPQLGIVRIGDDVEIGSNSSIDRATFGVTWIKSGTKIDNLVQIAHNVVIGENSLIVSQVGIAGSVTLGRNVVFGGQSGASGHQTIGDGTMVAGMAAVHGDQPPGSKLSGVPAIDARQWFKSAALFSKLPEIVRDMRRIKKELARLSENTGTGKG